MGGIPDPFAGFGPTAKAKLLFLGSTESIAGLMDRVRSLNLEHVSPTRLKGLEISRHAASLAAQESSLLALMRRWFFARKPDAGFVLTDFPATLLQAKVLDEWLDARGESITAVYAGGNPAPGVVDYYRTLGLLVEAECPDGSAEVSAPSPGPSPSGREALP